MQRKNFISNLAVIIPAGMAAPKLLFENNAAKKNLITSNVLVLGAGNAGLFIAQQLKKQKINTLLLEPSGEIGNAAVYNHPVKAGVLKQIDEHTKASIQTISSSHYSNVEETVIFDFLPTTITRTENGFRVSNGTTAYETKKLVVALPVEMDLSTSSLHIKVTYQKNPLVISCKRKNQKNPATIRTISAAKMDEKVMMQFATEKSPGILAIL